VFLQIVIGLVVGVVVAASVHISRVDANGVRHKYRYVTGTEISGAPWVTFLWVHTFPIGFYAPAVLPMLFASMVSVMEAIGDVTATTEASHLQPFGPEFDSAVQGAVLADGLNTFWAALATMVPVVTYAQNNGVISLSGCAARRAGYACCFWLMLLGIIAKFAGIILTIPNCVLGAMTTFLFASVIVSGIGVLTSRKALSRRERFIVICSLGIGLGVNLVPAWINITGQQEYPNQGNFWPRNPNWNSGYAGFRDAIIILLSNGFSIGGLIALSLNLLLPIDRDEKKEEDGLPHSQPLPEERLLSSLSN
jgi:uracil-xanthine permease